MKPDKQCLENKSQGVFSARALSHEPEQLCSSTRLPLGPCQHVAPFRLCGGSCFDPLWGMSSFTVTGLLAWMSWCTAHFIFFLGPKKGGNCGQFKELGVVLTPKPLIIAEGWHTCILKTRQSAEMLGRAACSGSRSGCRTMEVCADFCPEQWQDDRDTQSSRICTRCRQETQPRRVPALPKKHFFIFLFPFPASFMYSGTSGAHHSKLQLQTIQSLRG